MAGQAAGWRLCKVTSLIHVVELTRKALNPVGWSLPALSLHVALNNSSYDLLYEIEINNIVLSWFGGESVFHNKGFTNTSVCAEPACTGEHYYNSFSLTVTLLRH